MADFEKNVFDAVTVSSGGGTQTSSSITVNEYDSMTLSLEGDANSSNFDLAVQGKTEQEGNWTDYDTTVTGEDITSNTNDSKSYVYDVADLNVARVKITNNAGSSTTMTMHVGKSE